MIDRFVENAIDGDPMQIDRLMESEKKIAHLHYLSLDQSAINRLGWSGLCTFYKISLPPLSSKYSRSIGSLHHDHLCSQRICLLPF